MRSLQSNPCGSRGKVSTPGMDERAGSIMIVLLDECIFK
jgi:hypothetical protein